jgi:hypothetical protein
MVPMVIAARSEAAVHAMNVVAASSGKALK